MHHIPKILFYNSLFIIGLSYGFISYHYQIFPYNVIIQAYRFINSIHEAHWYYQKTDYLKTIYINNKKAVYKAPTLLTSMGDDDTLIVKVIDIDGSILHNWAIDWFKLWPDAKHVPEEFVPKEKPGTHIHGIIILDNGDIIFNFEEKGLLRLDVCGNIVWKLPYMTHHSIFRDDENTLWVPGLKIYYEKKSGFPGHVPPYYEPTILRVSLDGKILKELSVNNLLFNNNLQGIVYTLCNTYLYSFKISNDTLHLNDIEIFSGTMKNGIFKKGDIMISLRNTNTIIIFDGTSLKVKCLSVGEFLRQHDPDFIDGNTISVFDNIHFSDKNDEPYSRILLKSFLNNTCKVYYKGDDTHPFYSNIMGKHQWLPNGNLLITEALRGRAFEIDKNGNIVWEYINIVKKGYTGILEEAQRISNKFTKDFFIKRIKECKKSDNN